MIEAQSAMLKYYLTPYVVVIGLPLLALLVFCIYRLHKAKGSRFIRPIGLVILYPVLAFVLYALVAFAISGG